MEDMIAELTKLTFMELAALVFWSDSTRESIPGLPITRRTL